MRKRLFKIACSTFLLTSGVAFAQPTLEPIAAYTNHPKNYTGVSLYTIPNFGGNASLLPYDIGVTLRYHFQSGVTSMRNLGQRWFLCKKNASTGAPIAIATNDVATLAGLPNTNTTCNGMLLDETNNRIYLFGSIANRAVIACYSISTLGIVNTFGTNGVQVLSDVESEAMDAELTSYGNFSVLLNEKDAANKNFISIVGITPIGNWLGYNQFKNANYESYGKRFRKDAAAGLREYYIAGKAINASSQSIPMIWQLAFFEGTPQQFILKKTTNNSFTNPTLGFGAFVDFDFTTTSDYIIAVGDGVNSFGFDNFRGIWAKYRIGVTFPSTFLDPEPSFKNGATLPGTGPYSNPFRRCLVDPNGYTVVLSYDPKSPKGSYGSGVLGYITIAGDAYVKKYEFEDVHKTSGMAKDLNGNVIVGGCDMLNYGVSTGKFTSYNGYWGGNVNKQIPTATKDNSEITFNVFPNPTSNALTISGIEEYGNSIIQIIDMSGKKVKELAKENIANQETTIDISDLKKGSYFVRLTAKGKSVMRKIVKQ